MGLAHQLPSVVLHHTYWLTVSRDYRVLGRSLEFADVFTIGTSLWMSNPMLEVSLRPLYERAWRDGAASGLELIRGCLCSFKLARRNGEMNVQFEYVDELETNTLAGLEDSLHRFGEAFATHRAAVDVASLRPPLRAV